MRFILIDEQRKQNAKQFLDKLPSDGKWCAEIKPYKRTRSDAQNRTMWMWYHIIAEEMGISSEELHEQMKVRVLGVETKKVLGQTLVMPKSTTNLRPKEMAEFLDAIDNLAKSLNIRLPYPDDYRYLTFKEPEHVRNN